MKNSRYIIGIDLGTTTTSLSFLDTLSRNPSPQSFPILQWESEGSVVEKEILPSFCYLASKKEVKDKRFLLPAYEKSSSKLEEGEVVLGSYARKLQTKSPGRVIHSAKSWLCHSGVNREGKVLPWSSEEVLGDKRLSPVEVQSLLLLHLRLVWNHKMASHSEEYRLENQKVIITVPASFDEVATELTLRAATLAGYHRAQVSLIEEPQAAFYHWLESSEAAGVFKNKKTQSVLVCDVGGGTTDFSLFQVKKGKITEGKSLEVERLKVSPHTLLGGDNIDLKIASLFEEEFRLKEDRLLKAEEWAELTSHTRELKEILFQESSSGEDLKVAINKSSGTRNLFQSALTLSLPREYLKEKVLESFFHEETTQASSALSDLGLPYAKNPSFSFHLKKFLGEALVHKVLFVGGSLIPSLLRNRFLQLLSKKQKQSTEALNSTTFELGVSRGAALYGESLRNPRKLSIVSGYPRNLYIEALEKESGERKLLCLLPQGEKNKNSFYSFKELPLKMAVNQEMALTLYSSLVRPEDKRETFYKKENDDFQKVAPLLGCVELENRKAQFLDIVLSVGLTETGLLNIFCEPKSPLSGEENAKWEFTFNVQDKVFSERTENQDTGALPAFSVDSTRLEEAKQHLLLYFGKGKGGQAEKPVSSKILKDYESLFSCPRKEWPLATLRTLSSVLIQHKNTRGRSPAHEATWLNLCGYFLRPGYGELSDPLVVRELSKIFEEGLRHPSVTKVQNEWWVFWRRISGGLSKEKQEKIFSKLLPKLKGPEVSAESLLTLGSLELVSTERKALLAKQLTNDLLTKGSSLFVEQKFWALTRLCSRVMLYSGSENILNPRVFEPLAHRFFEVAPKQKEKWKTLLLRFYLHTGRKVGERTLDLEEELKAFYLKELETLGAEESQKQSLLVKVKMKEEERQQLLGDSLPCGFLL